MCGFEGCSLTLREEHRLWVCEKPLSRKVFGPMRDEVTGEWRRLQIKELCALYSTQNIIRGTKSRRMRREGYVARMGGKRGVYKVLFGRSKGRGPFGKPRHRWESNIKNDLQQVGWGA